MTDKQRVLILGGGFAALETAFLLRMRAHDVCEIKLVTVECGRGVPGE